MNFVEQLRNKIINFIKWSWKEKQKIRQSHVKNHKFYEAIAEIILQIPSIAQENNCDFCQLVAEKDCEFHQTISW